MDEILKKCRGKLIPADIAISYAEFKHTRQLAALTGAMADAIEAERNEGKSNAAIVTHMIETLRRFSEQYRAVAAEEQETSNILFAQHLADLPDAKES